MTPIMPNAIRPSTPEPVRTMNLVLAKPETYERGPSPTSQQTLNEGIRSLEKLDSPRRNGYIRKAASVFAKTLFEKEGPASPYGHETITNLPNEIKIPLHQLDKLYSGSQEVDDEADKLLPSRTIDLRHITGEDLKGGMHVHSDSSPILHNAVQNANTGVICGKWDEIKKDGSTKQKYSSCFPYKQPQAIIEYALSPDTMTLAEDKNKRLIGKENLYAVAYLRPAHLFKIKEYYKSIFPLFFYGRFTTEDKPYSFASNISPIDGKTIIKIARDIVRSSLPSLIKSAPTQVMFIKPDSLIIDIAPQLSDRTKVPQGICMEFSDSCFKDLSISEKARPDKSYSYSDILSCVRN